MSQRTPHTDRQRRRAWGAVAMACAALLAALTASAASAELLTFGSPLSVPATLNTSENLNYEGSNVALPGSVFHIGHDGSDTALWNVTQPAASPSAPAAGQVVSVKLEGCAQQPAGAPAPLTQIHFQDLAPVAGGGAKVMLTSQAFEIPVCGTNGASGSTITTYAPEGLCVNAGDYVDFNDEGGFVGGENGPPPYPAGVPYEVIGAVPGATMDSFVLAGGTNNGDTVSPSDRTASNGFASNSEEELMLQATLGTGPDAVVGCPGGTKGAGPTKPSGPPAPPLKVSKQTDGLNHRGIVSVALYCHAKTGCPGALTLTALLGHGSGRVVHRSFSLPGGTTTHVPIHLTRALVALVRKHHAGVPMRLQATTGGQTFTQTIVVRIF